MSKIILSCDSTTDMGEEFYQKHNIIVNPLHIILNDKSYEDLVNIVPEDIYSYFDKYGVLPQTSAVNVQEYIDRFKPYVDDGYEIIHIGLGHALSASYTNSTIAANELGNVYTVDSQNLSCASGFMLLEALKRIEKGMDAKTIASEIQSLAGNSHCTFIVDKLDYLKAGGRCSALVAFGANLLNIKPRIDVCSDDGSLSVGAKYRGKFGNVLETYLEQQLQEYDNIVPDQLFLVHAGVEQSIVDRTYQILKNKNYFKNITIARASCTISSHCGPGTLGIGFTTA